MRSVLCKVLLYHVDRSNWMDNMGMRMGEMTFQIESCREGKATCHTWAHGRPVFRWIWKSLEYLGLVELV